MELFKSEKFRNHVEDVMKQRHLPGFAAAIVDNGEIASHGWGYASVSDKVRCTADTLFDIASASKSMTAASVGVLVDDDEKYPDVQWDAKVSKLLPGDFVLADQYYTDQVTVDDMLGHRTGLPGHDLSYLGTLSKQQDTPKSVTQNLRNLPLSAGLREKYMYNNMMYTVATHLVETKTGQTFAEFLDSTFFKPLKMHSSHLEPSRARSHGLGSRITDGHAWKRATKSYLQFSTPDCPEAQGAGSIMTSANDYILWVQALMDRTAPLNEEICKALIKSRSLQNPEFEELDPLTSPISYSAGLETYYYRGHLVIGHDGAVPGFGSMHFWVPEFKFGAVLLGNSAAGAYDVCKIVSRELIDEALKIPAAERLDWTDIVKFTDDEKEEEEEAETLEKARQKLCPGIGGENEEQTRSLDDYTGVYRNLGYHDMKMEIKEGKLFIDASDRSMGFKLTFEHVCGQAKYVAHLEDYLDLEGFPMLAEFVFEGNRAVRLGLEMEEDLGDLTWFDRTYELPRR